MSDQSIWINPRGRFANQMFQYMLALAIEDRLGKKMTISGHNLPEWGLVGKEKFVSNDKQLVLQWNNFNLSQVIFLLEYRIINQVIIDGWGMRLENFARPQKYSQLFTSSASFSRIRDDEILINVRAEDIISGWHSLYYPLPFAFYRKVINDSGLSPVFMGQLEPNIYTDELRKHFSTARFLTRQSVIEDFQTIRNAKNVAVSISSFAWLASWISETAQVIYYPVSGLLDPRKGGAMLMPTGDSRYRFYNVPFLSKEQRAHCDLLKYVNSDHQVSEMDEMSAQKYLTMYLFPRNS